MANMDRLSICSSCFFQCSRPFGIDFPGASANDIIMKTCSYPIFLMNRCSADLQHCQLLIASAVCPVNRHGHLKTETWRHSLCGVVWQP